MTRNEKAAGETAASNAAMGLEQEVQEHQFTQGNSAAGEPTIADDDLFNPERVRVSGDTLAGVSVEKQLTTVPVRRPSRQAFIRVHPDEAYRLDTLLLELKDEGEIYLLAKALAADLPGAHLAR